MLNVLIEDAEKGDDYLFFSTYLQEGDEEIQDFFQMYDAKRKDKGLNVKGLAPRVLEAISKVMSIDWNLVSRVRTM